MAKKDKDSVDFGEDMLADLDFGDMNFGDPFAGGKGDRKGRSPIEEFKRGAFKSVKDKAMDSGMLRRLIFSALPKGYTQAFNAYDALDTSVGDVIKDNANELNPYLLKLKRKTDQMGPIAKRMLPKSLREAMDDAEYQKYASSAGSSDNSELNANMAGLHTLFAAQQAQDRVHQNVRDAVSDTRAQKRFASEMEVQTSIGRGIGRLVGYQDTITINYHRKSLEIGYRQLDVGMRTLRAQTAHFSETKRFLDAIVHNTALPDFVKMRHTEVVKQQLSNRLANKAAGAIGKWGSQYFGKVTKNASDMLGAALMAKGQIDQQTSLTGQTRAQAFGGMAGNLFGDLLASGGEMLLDAGVSKIKPHIDKNQKISGIGNWLTRNLTGIPQRLHDFSKSDTKGDGIGSDLLRGLKALLDTYEPTSSISGRGIESLDKPAVFDNLFHKSVTEIIPGYLASMDKHIRVMATGQDQEEMRYSHYADGFVGAKTLQKQHLEIGIKNNSGKATRQEVDAIIRDMGAQDLSIDALRALRRQLMRDLASNHSSNIKRYVEVKTWDKEPEEVAEELINFFGDQFGISAHGTNRMQMPHHAKREADVAESFYAAQSRMSDVGERMNGLSSVIGRRAFRELGLTNFGGRNSDAIDLDKLYDLFVNDGDEFDPKAKPPTVADDNAIKRWRASQEKLRQEEAERKKVVHSSDVVDVDAGDAKGGTWSPKITGGNINQRVRVSVRGGDAGKIAFPELMNVSDDGTHRRLDTLIQFGGMNLELMDLLTKRTFGGGGGGNGGGPSGPSGNPFANFGKFKLLGSKGYGRLNDLSSKFKSSGGFGGAKGNFQDWAKSNPHFAAMTAHLKGAGNWAQGQAEKSAHYNNAMNYMQGAGGFGPMMQGFGSHFAGPANTAYGHFANFAGFDPSAGFGPLSHENLMNRFGTMAGNAHGAFNGFAGLAPGESFGPLTAQNLKTRFGAMGNNVSTGWNQFAAQGFGGFGPLNRENLGNRFNQAHAAAQGHFNGLMGASGLGGFGPLSADNIAARFGQAANTAGGHFNSLAGAHGFGGFGPMTADNIAARFGQGVQSAGAHLNNFAGAYGLGGFGPLNHENLQNRFGQVGAAAKGHWNNLAGFAAGHGFGGLDSESLHGRYESLKGKASKGFGDIAGKFSGDYSADFQKGFAAALGFAQAQKDKAYGYTAGMMGGHGFGPLGGHGPLNGHGDPNFTGPMPNMAGMFQEAGQDGPEEPQQPGSRKGNWYSPWNLTKSAVGGTAKGLGWYFKNSYKLLGKTMGLGGRGIVGAAKLPFKRIDGLGVCDIYRAGDKDPVMTARDLRRGVYVDEGTKKPITKLKDITGAVRDLRTNLIVITDEDFTNGLYNGEGESLASVMSRGGFKLAGAVAKGIWNYNTFTYGLMGKAVKAVYKGLKNELTSWDAYLPGDTEPRLRSSFMRKGYYRDKDGKPIMSLDEITGSVFDIHGIEVVSAEEMAKYQSFYTRNGSVLWKMGKGLAGGMFSATKFAGKAALWYGKQTLKFYKAMGRGIASVGRGLKGLGKRMFGKGGGSGIGMLDGEMAELAVQIQGEQLNTQLAILKLLQSKFNPEHVHGDVDGDGVREWSWQDILKRRKAKQNGGDNPPGTDVAVVNAIEDMSKKLQGKLDDLEHATEEAGEESLLDKAADISDITGHGKKGGRARPKRGFRSGRGIRGKIGNGVSKIGKVLGKIPGAKWIGRGAMALASGAGEMAMAALPAVGSALMTGAGALASGIGAAGSAVVGALGLPVILGIAAVAGIGYLGYKFYKSSQAKSFPILYLRMTQYGVSPTDQARVEKMIQLEGLLKDFVKIGKDGSSTIDGALPMDQIYKVMGIDPRSKREQLFVAWIAKRFRPVYLAHCTAMDRIRGTTALESSDTGIGDGDLDTFISIVDMGNMQAAYDDKDTSPFDGDLTEDSGDVRDAVQMLRGKRKVINAEKGAVAAVAGAVGVNAVAAKNTTLTVSNSGSNSPEDIAKGISLAAPAVVGGRTMVYNSTVSAKGPMKSLDVPTAVRFKTYGLKDLNLAKCLQLQKAEEVYWGAVVYAGTASATIGSDEDQLKQKVKDIFKPANETQDADFVRWLDFRFMPVFLQYCISVRKRYNGDVRDAARNMTGPDMKQVLEETTMASKSTMFGSTSVWQIQNSPWPGEQLETMAGSTKLYIDSLDTGDTSKVLDVAGMKTQQQTSAANNSYQSILTNTALGNTKTNTGVTGVGNNGNTMGNYAGIYGGKQTAGGVQGQSSSGYGTGSMLYSGTIGVGIQHPGGGTGGDVNSLPQASGKGYAACGPTVRAAAKMVGFDETIALVVAAIESGFDPTVDNGTACGLFQFTKGTWKGMLDAYAATYGIAAGTPRTDARANAIFGCCYLKENYTKLAKALGRAITDVDLYTSHFLGYGGALRFLSAPRDGSSDKYVYGADVISNNGSVFYENYKKPGQRLRNVGEVLAELDRRLNVGRKMVGAPLSAGAVASTPSNVPEGAGSGVSGPAGSGQVGDGTGKPSEGGAMGTGGAKDAAPDAPAGTSAPAGAGTTGIMAATPATAAAAAAGASGAGGGGSATTAASASSLAPSSPSGGGAPVGVLAAAEASIPPGPSATRAAAAESVRTNAAASAESMGTTNELLQKQLDMQTEARDLLKQIRDQMMVDRISARAATDKPQGGQIAAEPAMKSPLQTKRLDAVT